MKKYLALVLAVILCILPLGITAYAEDSQIIITPIQGAPGDEVSVDVNISGNPGLAYLKLKVGYSNEDLTLVRAENTGLLQGIFTTSQRIDVNPYVLQWMNAGDSVGDGIIARLIFKINDTASAGDKEITLSFEECYNQNLDDVVFSTSNGKVTVTGGSDTIIAPYKDQIRFQKNTDGTYAGKFDYRTLAMISEEAFKATFESEEDALKMIQEIGFVYAAIQNVSVFDKAAAIALVENNAETKGYEKVPVNYISTAFSSKDNADADYVISCIVTNIDDVDAGLHALAYIKYTDKNGETKYSYYDTATTSVFKPLFDQHFGSAFPA